MFDIKNVYQKNHEELITWLQWNNGIHEKLRCKQKESHVESMNKIFIEMAL